MSSTFTRTVCGLGVALLVSACGDTIVGDNLAGAVVTVVDSIGPALESARTFALPDTIVEVPLGSSTISHAADHQIIASIRNHFIELGWEDVTKVPNAHPDVVVLTADATRVQTGTAYGDWFGAWGYLPYWGAGVNQSWAWGIPGGAIPYVYETGTVLITMLDLRAQDATTRRIPLLWAGILDGILPAGANAANQTPRIIDGIDQAFAQSPYLRIPRS
jgi:hypothetical protein